MPRILGVKERRDQMVFDTSEIKPGHDHRLFGNANIGDRENCNLQIAGQLGADASFIILSVGARVLNQSKEAEKIILGYMQFCFCVGDRPQIELQGPCLSTLLDQQPRGYVLASPIVIPVRQNVSLSIRASDEMMEAVKVRFFVFGQSSRDVY